MFSSSDNEDIEISLCLDSFENFEADGVVRTGGKDILPDGIVRQAPENVSFKGNLNGSPASSIIRKCIKSPLSETPPKVTYERKFPGPAGLFPKKQCLSSSKCVNDKSFPKYCEDENQIRSQKSAAVLDNAPWKYFYDRIDERCKEARGMLEKFRISSLKRMTMISRSNPCKIPLFVAMVLHVDFSITDPAVILKDISGEIHGTIHRDIWEKFSSFLTIGSIIFLRNVGVLFLYNSQHLNITLSNLISIYANSSNDGNDEFTREIVIRDFLNDENVRDLRTQWTSYLCNLESKSYQHGGLISNNSLTGSPNNNHVNRTGSPLFTGYTHKLSPALKLKSNDSRKSSSPYFSRKIDTCNKTDNKMVLPNVAHDCSPTVSISSARETKPDNTSSSSFKFQIKQPRLIAAETDALNVKENLPQMQNSSQFSILGTVHSEDLSLVSSVLDGIDADSIFDDF